MTGTKVFAEKGRVRLIGDECDIGIVSNYRQDVWDWCDKNKIDLEYQGSMAGIDVWRIRDDQQRAWFALKWQQ